MPYTKDKKSGRYKSPSGKTMTKKQVQAYYSKKKRKKKK